MDDRRIDSRRIIDEAGRSAALLVLSVTYQKEKGWITEPAAQFPSSNLGRPDISWFIVRLDGHPVGVLRTLYDPPLLQYTDYRLELLDPHINVESFLKQHRIAEVGRFAVLATHRSNLMRKLHLHSVTEVVLYAIRNFIIRVDQFAS